MEAPLKKKKLNPQDNVTIILSERLFESHGLINQLGGNKFRTRKIEFAELPLISSISNKKINCIDSNQNSLFIIDDDQQCFEYNFTSQSWKLKFKATNAYFISYFKIDNLGKYIYLYLDDNLYKYEINDEKQELNKQIWCLERNEPMIFEYCESKNEIYLFDSSTLYIIDTLNGSTKRDIEVISNNNIQYYDFKDGIFLDEKLEILYLYFKYYEEKLEDNSSDDSYDDDSDNETIVKYCWIGVELTGGGKCKIESGKSVMAMSFSEYFAVLDRYEGSVRVFKDEKLLQSYETPFQRHFEGKGKVVHFDKNSNRMYYCSGNDIRVVKINVSSCIENIPLSRKSYNSLKRLGAEFPKPSELESSTNSLQYFLNVKLSSAFWYIDGEIKKFFFFKLKKKQIHNNGIIFLNKKSWIENRERKYNISILADQPEAKVDFPIHISFKSPEDGQDSLKCYKLSEFLSKLNVCEVFPIIGDIFFLISYELVYEELVMKSIINPEEESMIDDKLLIEQYRKCISRREVSPTILLGKCLFNKITKTLSNRSTVRLGGVEFVKMDLIVLALNFCSEPAIITETIMTL